MSLSYRVYTNAADGGPVDYSAPAIETSGLTADLSPMAPGSDLTAVVRAYDTLTGLEDQSTQARVRVVLDALGNDATGYPRPPVGLTVRATSGGTARLAWSYPLGGNATGFHVYLSASMFDFTAPAASIAHDTQSPGKAPSAYLDGLVDGVVYGVIVRAFNASGEETNVNAVSVTGRTAGPSPAVSLSGSAVP